MHDQPLELGGESPFSAYRLLSLGFGAGLLSTAWSSAAKRVLAQPLGLADFALIAGATHKLANIIATERVTMALRAPFTRQRDEGRNGVRKEIPKEHGLHRAIGELLTCPYCLAPWVSAALLAGHIFVPVPTRVISTVFALTAVADLVTELKKTLSKAEPAREAKPTPIAQVIGAVS